MFGVEDAACERAWHLKPTDLPTRPSKTPTVCEERPVLRVYYLSLVPGPHPTGSLARGSGTIIHYQVPCWVSASSLEQQRSVTPSKIVPCWPLPAPRRMASKFLSQLVSNNIQMLCHKLSSPSGPGPQVPRQRLAQAMPSGCPSKSKSSVDCWWLGSVSFVPRK